jgi:23S rRNA pseudouridine1911/1915/1917 synthase
VLIAAKTDEAFHFLKAQFAERNTEKRYQVLVYGNVIDEAGTINFPIARSKTKARMAARAEGQDGKEAITHYDVLNRYSTTSHLAVRIETGRTHQIRAHMFALGHPVVGDLLYVQRGLKLIPLPRLFLHAESLTIDLPNGERQTFSAPLPVELTDFLTTLKPLPKV